MRYLLLMGFISAQLVIAGSVRHNPTASVAGTQVQASETSQRVKRSVASVGAERGRKPSVVNLQRCDSVPVLESKTAGARSNVTPANVETSTPSRRTTKFLFSKEVKHEPTPSATSFALMMVPFPMWGAAVPTPLVQSSTPKGQSDTAKDQSNSPKEESANGETDKPLPAHLSWTMIDVCGQQGQADCHLLEFPDGKHVLIDAAEGWDAKGAALDFLQKAGITHLELVVLSHVHWDHYGKLIDFINSGIVVDQVVVNLPASREIADVEIPWGCNWNDVQSLLQFLRDKNIPYWTPQPGDKLMEVTKDGITSALEVVCLFDGINTPVGRTDINDTSILLRLRHGNIKALFTGDLNNSLGTWLATSDLDLGADLLKVPHHGTEGLAPDSFFDRVAPKAALVPSPIELWYSLRSKRAREYFRERNIPTYVSGVDGTVKVFFSENSFEIETSGKP